MTLPPLIPFISRQSASLTQDEWQEFIDSWVKLTGAYLALPTQQFCKELEGSQSLPTFLSSYLAEFALLSSTELHAPGFKALKHHCFKLIHRIWFTVEPPPENLVSLQFLGRFCRIYAHVRSLSGLINSLWAWLDQKFAKISANIKRELIQALDTQMNDDSKHMNEYLNYAATLLRVCRDYGRSLMVGSELLDSLIKAWNAGHERIQRKLSVLTYLLLNILLEAEDPKVSQILDHLYTLLGETERKKGQPSLLLDVVSATPLLRKLRQIVEMHGTGRAKALLQNLDDLRRPKSGSRHNTKLLPNSEDVPVDALHSKSFNTATNASLIIQIQDLFPSLDAAAISKLLHNYDNDVERLTASLLEKPGFHGIMNDIRIEKSDGSSAITGTVGDRNTTKPSAPGAQLRRNVFDHDSFDRLEISSSNLKIGRQEADILATPANKTSILSALAAFDSDDDERDDTYDVEDVGGTVDVAIPSSDDKDTDFGNRVEQSLFAAWKAAPEVFARDAATRRGTARSSLRSETGMTDEAIEGWSIMLGRQPGILRRLEEKFSSHTGTQEELRSTRWRGNEASETESGGESAGQNSNRSGPRGRGQAGARGQGRGARNRPLRDDSSSIDKQGKTAHKGSRANHNRRDQRARKMARAGFAG